MASSGGGAPSAQAGEAAAKDRVPKILEFLRTVGKLKEVKRTGWVRSGVKGAESVSDHMYRMAMMGFALGAADGVDSAKCIKMALVHDLAESLIGDLVTEGERHRQDKITREEKIRLEREALHGICERLGADSGGAEIRELWEEFETGDTPEARHLRDLDKFEMVLQACEYEESQSMGLPDFFRTTEGKFGTPIFKALDEEVRRRRAKREQGGAAEGAAESSDSAAKRARQA